MRTDIATTKPERDSAFYIRRLERVLAAMGSLYLPQDLITAMQEGRMHPIVEGDSVAIVQIDQYPRQRVLHVVVAVGEMEHVDKIHQRIVDFAAANNCGVIMAFGRMGWMPQAIKRGWRVKAKNFVYMLEN